MNSQELDYWGSVIILAGPVLVLSLCAVMVLMAAGFVVVIVWTEYAKARREWLDLKREEFELQQAQARYFESQQSLGASD